jgi:plasmid replication initiation protein
VRVYQLRYQKGIAEIQVSHKLMPFLVELSPNTLHILYVAMSLKSKWSQRMYELCQKWQGTDGFRISVDELRLSFMLEENTTAMRC